MNRAGPGSFSLPRGLLVTFEGGDGSGKSTLIQRLANALQEEGFSVVTTREPGGTQLGDHIRHCLLDPNFKAAVGQKAELLLFLAARLQHIQELILPAIEKGQIVLCDRFNDSTIAYQGIARGLGFEYVETLCQMVCQGLTPDLTFFLDVTPAEGLRRTKEAQKDQAATGEVDRIEAEALSFHEKVRQGFLTLAARYPQRIQTIDAHRSPDAVFEAAFAKIHEFLASFKR